jgi:hypothetical protein
MQILPLKLRQRQRWSSLPTRAGRFSAFKFTKKPHALSSRAFYPKLSGLAREILQLREQEGKEMGQGQGDLKRKQRCALGLLGLSVRL